MLRRALLCGVLLLPRHGLVLDRDVCRNQGRCCGLAHLLDKSLIQVSILLLDEGDL